MCFCCLYTGQPYAFKDSPPPPSLTASLVRDGVDIAVVSSSRTVGDTEEELRGMGGHIQSSHKLLTKYGRREWTDRLLILLALAFFFASVLYIVKKRLFPSTEDDSIV